VPGIGKSRLVYELFQTIENGTFGLVFWRHGRSLSYGDGVTFWALREVVKSQAGILESDSSEEAGDKLRRAVERFVPDTSEAEWLVRRLRPLAGLEADEEVSDRRGESFAAWRRFLEAIGDERPLVLVFEDLHWADDVLLDFVDYLVDRASGVPLLVLCTARPELITRRPGWGGGKVNSVTIQLSPLSEDETATLVHALLGRSAIARLDTLPVDEHGSRQSRTGPAGPTHRRQSSPGRTIERPGSSARSAPCRTKPERELVRATRGTSGERASSGARSARRTTSVRPRRSSARHRKFPRSACRRSITRGSSSEHADAADVEPKKRA
jgi:hypothetical protein